MSTTPPYKMTTTYQNNLTAKNANFYYTIAGRNITAPGKVAAGEWIDTIRGRDRLQVRIQERVALVTMNADKIPYTDPGTADASADDRQPRNRDRPRRDCRRE